MGWYAQVNPFFYVNNNRITNITNIVTNIDTQWFFNHLKNFMYAPPNTL